MGTRENKVETYFKDQIKSLGGTSRKWVSPGYDGVPDQIVIIKFSIFFVEVKTADGHLSTAQKREHERLRDNGANVSTVYGYEGVDMIMFDIRMFNAPASESYKSSSKYQR